MATVTGESEEANPVRGFEGTLLQAVELGFIPEPPLVDWRGWMHWRATTGGRPTRARDGRVIHNKQESRIWKEAMVAYYGEGWRDRNEEAVAQEAVMQAVAQELNELAADRVVAAAAPAC